MPDQQGTTRVTKRDSQPCTTPADKNNMLIRHLSWDMNDEDIVQIERVDDGGAPGWRFAVYRPARP